MSDYFANKMKNKENSAWDVFGWFILGLLLAIGILLFKAALLAAVVWLFFSTLNNWQSVIPEMPYLIAFQLSIMVLAAKMLVSRGER